MTDDTQPEAMDLADWLEAVGGGPSAKRCAALLREQHARIAELESELEAVGAGGVLALSAAPAEQEEAAQRLRKTLDIDPGDVNDPLHPRYIAGFKSGHAAGRRRASPAATPTPPAEQQAQTDAVYAELPEPDFGPGRYLGKAIGDAYTKDQMRDFADRTHALRMKQAAPKAAPLVGNSDFDHKTAADLLNNKTVSDEAVRKFVAMSRWAHNERAALSATLLAMHGVLTSREAEIALLKKALMEAEAAPQQEAQEPCGWTTGITWRPNTRLQSEQVIKITRDAQPNYGYTTPIYTAPQQGAQEPCQTCIAMARTVMMDQVSFDRKPDCYGIRQITNDDGVEEWEDIRTSPDVAREEANDMMATGRGEIYEVVPLWTTPQPAPAPAPLSEMPYEKRKAIQEGEQIGASDAWFKARHEMLDTVDRRNVFRAGFDRGWSAALAAQKGK